jgi:hypothetical protein
VILNTDAPEYGGWGTVVEPTVESRPEPLRDREHRVTFRLPGLSIVVLALDPE